jgi:hypothetical protein
MMWLDWKLFGNGYGVASPYFDDVFYWLNDTNAPRTKKGLHGNWYHWIGGFGAQLQSFEWFMPKPGTRRRILGKEFVVFSAERRWLRVRVTWRLPRDIRDYSEISALKDRLLNWNYLQ